MYLWLKHDREKAMTDLSADLLPKMTDAVKTIGVNIEQWGQWISQVRTSSSARYQVQVVINQIIEAIQSGNQTTRQALGAFLTPRYPSQLFEALLEGALMFLIAFLVWKKPRKPGVVGSLWLTCYAIVRIIGEQFRLPDADIGYQLFGLTRGQWLSLGMLVISLGLLVYTTRRKVPVIGGWGPEAIALRKREP
jgi:phosphatidylglycerol:prolipoprotein diacylglycerol transferase